jgi:hyaluronan synthase
VFVYLLQLREAALGHLGALVLFPVYATLVWVNWGIRASVSRRYRPWTRDHDVTASVIVPVVDEPVDLFFEVLQRIQKQSPHQAIVVINGPRNPGLEEVCMDTGVEWTWTDVPGKRNAVRMGVEMATGEICVLVDSDTLWTEETLPELLKPFRESSVGGVTTSQRVLDPRRTFLTRWADWMEDTRALYSMPAQSVLGQVGCLPGRTIAFRTSILRAAMPGFLNDRFLGIFLEVSDDRTLTNLCLKQGYRTVYQSTSLVYTDCPVRVGKMYRQQLRWARGSQYNTLRMFPWMLGHTPLLAFFFACDIVLPFILLGTFAGWIYRVVNQTGTNFVSPLLDAFPGPVGWAVAATLIVVGSAVSMWLRQARHLEQEHRDWPWMPVYILFSSFFLMPVRLAGFVRMAHAASWGTRRNAFKADRHFNPYAAVPYAIAAAFIGAELAFVIHAPS